MTYDAFASAWWPYLFILVAGTLATEIWRWIGVLAGSMLSEDSEALVVVRAVATSLVAAVVGTLILFPSGSLEATTMPLRVAAASLGWISFRLCRKSVLAGVLTAELILIGGWLAGF